MTVESFAGRSIWGVLGVEPVLNENGDVPEPCAHKRVSVSGYPSLVDPGVVQLVAALEHTGVTVLDSCQNAWGAGVSYIVVPTASDAEQASRKLGRVFPGNLGIMVTAAAANTVLAKGPWFDAGSGWAVGVTSIDGVKRPVIVWPARDTAALTQKLWRDYSLRPVKVKKPSLFKRIFS